MAIDLTGQTAIVTGANSGLGLEVARGLARLGAEVVMTARDRAKGEAALQQIRARDPGARLRLELLDLARLASVRAFAARFGEAPVHLLVNNAGVMAVPKRVVTEDGFELQFATNHLGHFALTGLLLPALLRSDAPRVVTVASLAHRRVPGIDFNDLQAVQKYDPWKAYGASKLANLLFALELDRRAGGSLLSVAAHPGVTTTNIVGAGPRLAGGNWKVPFMEVVFNLFGQRVERGALPILRAATDLALKGGAYLGPNGPGGLRGMPVPVAMTEAARDPAAAARLWDISEKLTGVSYAFRSASAAMAS
jgi:NAD(P)-dependent dehydrogenase (short-subunit alcohol dehydrogenase family)